MPRDERPALPAFAPVPRRQVRHDGWTPERQRAFIEALADTGSVATASRQVNMSSEGAYALRRHPQADEFRRAWDAALAMGYQRLKDEAYERALNGQLVPVFVAGKLMGYRRKKNDRLLMFILRHYGPSGPASTARPLTVNVFTASATAIAGPAPQSTEVIGAPLPVIDNPPSRELTMTDPASDPADTVARFAGVPLDAQAQAQLLAALTANAARHRALAIEDDPSVPFVHVGDAGPGSLGELEYGDVSEDVPDRKPGEVAWETLGDDAALARIDEAVADFREGQQEALSSVPHSAPARALPAPTPYLPTPDPAVDLDGPDWASPAERRGLAHIDAMLEAAKAEIAAPRRPPAPNSPPPAAKRRRRKP